MTAIPLPTVAAPRLWHGAQAIGVVLTGVLLAALVVWPRTALHVLWDMVIPLLPAVFVINPMLWRNVCPLATLNAVTGDRVGMRQVGARAAHVGWAVGIVLLALMVPARRFLFNTNGLALAITIVIVALLATAAGLVTARRAGFCNTLCPVLPVEKLYGQAALVRVGNPRCPSCALCTPVGCLELAATKTIAQTIGPARRSISWLTTPFGIFVGAFPGFIVGYFTTENGALADAWGIYGHIGVYALVSYALVVAIQVNANVPVDSLVQLLGGAAVLLYYWLSAPTLAASYGLPAIGSAFVRVVAIVLGLVVARAALTRQWRYVLAAR